MSVKGVNSSSMVAAASKKRRSTCILRSELQKIKMPTVTHYTPENHCTPLCSSKDATPYRHWTLNQLRKQPMIKCILNLKLLGDPMLHYHFALLKTFLRHSNDYGSMCMCDLMNVHRILPKSDVV